MGVVCEEKTEKTMTETRIKDSRGNRSLLNSQSDKQLEKQKRKYRSHSPKTERIERETERQKSSPSARSSKKEKEKEQAGEFEKYSNNFSEIIRKIEWANEAS